MKKYNLSVMTVALVGSLTSLSALGATGVGSINHDIRFGGIIAESAPKWVWSLPQNTVRIDLRDGDGVVDTASSTKVWDIMQNRQPYRFLEGYMEPTVNGVAMMGLNADVKYLQNGAEVTPSYDTTTNATLLSLKATGNKDTTPVEGSLALTLQPVLLLAQAATAGDTTIIGKQLAGVGVTQANVNATQAYNNAKVKLESQQSKVGATSITYDTNTLWPENTLDNGNPVTIPMIGGYASTMTAGKLSFPQNTPVSQWESAITIQVQYR